MPRFKFIDLSPRLLRVDFDEQLLPGSFEHALSVVIDRIDLSGFDARFRNDLTGATAYAPSILLKVILFAYSRGIVSSRGIARACEEHCTFVALSADTRPHFTTIARFISELGEQAAEIFGGVLALCAREGLIGREMFAIDGVKLPSNASKRRSGTRADFQRQADRMEEQARVMTQRHRAEDRRRARRPADRQREREQQRLERLARGAAELRQWLEEHPEDRKGKSMSDGRTTVRQSNRTDIDSAKMATDKGVIQGYTGVAAVDGTAQIIVVAQAHGTGSEQELLLPVADELKQHTTGRSLALADSGYHSEAGLRGLHERGIGAIIADHDMRKRDERFAGQQAHHDAAHPYRTTVPGQGEAALYKPADFRIDPKARTCVCPAGHALNRKGANVRHGNRTGMKFEGTKAACIPCTHRQRCLKKPEVTPVRQVVLFDRVNPGVTNPLTQSMRERIDSAEGRALYERRFAIVEPVFGNIRHNKKLNRFTLRGRTKVDGQWKLFCTVHNIEKLARHGFAQ